MFVGEGGVPGSAEEAAGGAAPAAERRNAQRGALVPRGHDAVGWGEGAVLGRRGAGKDRQRGHQDSEGEDGCSVALR